MIRIGILGAGQLSQMLIEAASAMGVAVSVFSESGDTPAARMTNKLHIGQFNKNDLRRFFETVDLVLFESEFVDVPLIREAARGLTTSFMPELSVMEVFQDKLSQKQFCVDQNIPTSRYEVYDGGDPMAWFQRVYASFDEKLVLKWSRLGYDGKGNLFARGSAPKEEDIVTFISKAVSHGGTVYAEELVPFDQELAIVCCRNAQGKSYHYPVVISEQREGICLNVKGPASSLGISEEICKDVAMIAETIGVQGKIVGTYAVELFLHGSQVYVNEIAPRVHNTGHYTQDASMNSQFCNHIRAALGWELGATDCWPFFSMRNILGPKKIHMSYAESPDPSETSLLHWYGKKDVRPGRKLGHINTVAMTEAELSARILDMLQDEEVWISRLKDFT